jgi:hypothetical protein
MSHDLNRPTEILKQEVAAYPAEVRQVALTKASDAWLAITAEHGRHGPTGLRLGLEGALVALHKAARAAVRKSQAQATADAESTFFDYSSSPTAAQASAAGAHTIIAQEIANTSGAVAQAFGIDPNDAANAAKLDAIIRVVAQDVSYGQNETFAELSARSEASVRESGGLASPADWNDRRQQLDADEINAANGTPTNFSGDRGLGYTNQRSEMGTETGFSSAATRSVGSGTPEGASSSDQSIVEIAARAYAAGMLAGRAGGPAGGFASPGASDPQAFAKAARQRALSAARKRG